MIRFAHGFGWDIKDDAIRERVHTGEQINCFHLSCQALSAAVSPNVLPPKLLCPEIFVLNI